MKRNGRLVFCCTVFCTFFLFASMAYGQELDRIRKAIRETGAQWVAGETSMTRLSAAERKARLGLLPPRAIPGGEVIGAEALYAPSLPAKLDWRNNGGNFVTSIKNQADCGSCWAFAAAGALESYYLIQNRLPGKDTDLSEQVMVSCCLECSEWLGGCNGGYIHIAAEFAREKGLPLESCYRYSATNGSCSKACGNWQASSYRIGDWNWVTPPDTPSNVQALKSALYTYGPLMIAFAVYDDFFSYKYGIYYRTAGSRLSGYHAVLLVGYDDSARCFIAKNSWDTNWGWTGYFNIAYDMVTDCSGDLTDPNNDSPGVCFGYETIAFAPGPFAGRQTSVNAARYTGLELAQESICSAFGSSLATRTEAASSVPLPTNLAGTTVRVTDAKKATRLAPLFFVSPGQVNYQIPPGTAPQMATVTVTSGDGNVSTGTIHVAARVDSEGRVLGPSVAPALFSADGSGTGVAAANALRVKADGTQTYEPVARYDAATSRYVPIPIDLGPSTDQVHLILYGTGIRLNSALSKVTVSLGGVSGQVTYAGQQGYYVGLDQVNVTLPRTLTGKGEVTVSLTVDGKPANAVTISIR